MVSLESLKQKFETLHPHLNERTRRLVAAGEARRLGQGGIALVHRASGLSRKAICKGIKELEAEATLPQGRIRRAGAGRPSLAEQNPALVQDLDALVSPEARGDPESPLRWTCKSTRTLAHALNQRGHQVSHTKVAQLLRGLGYSLQGQRKTLEGASHPDRDAQFGHINAQVQSALQAGQPVISVDTKKKELVGPYQNKGQNWQPQGEAVEVNGHDFPKPDVPRAYPYGLYDIGRNRGFVTIGTDHDTAAFAVASIRGWWQEEGRHLYPNATQLVITADSGGSNGWRSRGWKWELQQFADEAGLAVQVSHFPAGTSKWNPIEHRLFSFISSNWRGQPLCDYETIVNLIAHTTTAKGLAVKCRLDHALYPTGRKISAAQMELLHIDKDPFHGEWNYTLRPRPSPEMTP